MPPVAYALASDTAIGVVRAWTLARQKALNEALADDDATPLAIVGGLLLWLLRLGWRRCPRWPGSARWVIEECPVAPGRRARPAPRGSHADSAPRPVKAITAPSAGRISAERVAGRDQDRRVPGPGRRRYGPLAAFPLADVSRVCTELAPEVDLNPGAARTALRRHVLALQNGSR